MAQVVQEEVHGASGASGGIGTTSGGTSNNNNNNSNAVKSSNANLTTLGIKPAQYDFKGFNNNTSTYEAKVPENVESVEVFAILQDKKATIEGTGKRNLEIGKNALEVIVTAEDGTKKTFTINVTRGEEIEGQSNNNNEGLKELTIEGITLSPEFQTNVYEYTAKYIGEGTQLNLTAKATNDDYIVEITGNENLQEGENTITILVSKSNGTNVATYQVIVNKSLIDEEAIARQKQEETERINTIILICTIIGVILIIGIIVFMIIKRKKDNRVASLNDDDEDNNENNENNEEDNEYEELPKALIGQKKSDLEEMLKTETNENTNDENIRKEELKKKPIKGKRFKDE